MHYIQCRHTDTHHIALHRLFFTYQRMLYRNI